MAMAAALAACTEPPAATGLRPIPGEERAWVAVLGADARDRVRAGMQGPAAGHRAVVPPGPSPHVRWSDLGDALAEASALVEMAVVSREERPWGARFILKTIEGWPAELEVRREAPPRVYSATASVGVFGDRVDRAEALLAELERQLVAFSRKRRLDRE
jgi:hypothetical protein